MTENRSENAPADGESADTTSRIARLFDIRLVVGALLVVYGVVLIVQGLIDAAAAIRKAAGIRLNLWTGIGMLVVGLLMLLWMPPTPLQPPNPGELKDDGSSP